MRIHALWCSPAPSPHHRSSTLLILGKQALKYYFSSTLKYIGVACQSCASVASHITSSDTDDDCDMFTCSFSSSMGFSSPASSFGSLACSVRCNAACNSKGTSMWTAIYSTALNSLQFKHNPMNPQSSAEKVDKTTRVPCRLSGRAH